MRTLLFVCVLAVLTAARNSKTGITVQLEATRPFVPVGSNAMFMLTISNSGQIGFNNIEVTTESSELVTTCAKSSATQMEPGDKYSYVCAISNIQQTSTLSVRACADADTSTTTNRICSAFTQASVTVVTGPKIRIVKSIVGSPTCDGNVTFSIQLQNCGTSGLGSLRVRDPQAPDCDRDFSDVPSGSIIPQYACSGSHFDDGDTNTATVSATCSVSGQTVTDSSSVRVRLAASGVNITKTSNSPICVGATAVFAVVVTNPGCADLNHVVVTDKMAPDCARPSGQIARLAGGSSTHYMCTLDNVQKTFTNSISVTARSADSKRERFSDSAQTRVKVVPSSLSITKIPSTTRVVSGETVKFTITITNHGSSKCSSLVVSDSQTPACDNSFALLKPGRKHGTITYTCTTEPLTASLTNTITVTADCGGTSSCTGFASATATVGVDPARDGDCDESSSSSSRSDRDCTSLSSQNSVSSYSYSYSYTKSCDEEESFKTYEGRSSSSKNRDSETSGRKENDNHDKQPTKRHLHTSALSVSTPVLDDTIVLSTPSTFSPECSIFNQNQGCLVTDTLGHSAVSALNAESNLVGPDSSHSREHVERLRTEPPSPVTKDKIVKDKNAYEKEKQKSLPKKDIDRERDRSKEGSQQQHKPEKPSETRKEGPITKSPKFDERPTKTKRDKDAKYTKQDLSGVFVY